MRFGILITVIFLFGQSPLSAQTNLVPNPNFDQRKPGFDCRTYSFAGGLLEDFIEDWYALHQSPNVLFADCNGIQYTNPFAPLLGNGMIGGFYDLDPGQRYHSYFQVQLRERLIPSRKYYLEYYIMVPPEFIPIPFLGIHFLDTLIRNGRRFWPFEYIYLDPPHLEVDTPVGRSDSWTRIHHCFTVDKEYPVMSVGIFRHHTEVLPFVPPGYTQWNLAPIYDAFYLIEVSDSLELYVEDRRDTICVGECVTLSTNHSRIPGTFYWDLPGTDLLQSADSVVRVCYAQAGEYDVGLIVEDCWGTYRSDWPRRIVVLDRPDVGHLAELRYRIAEGDTLQLSVCDDGDWTVRWEGSSALQCTNCRETSLIGRESVQVQAILSNAVGCSDTCRYAIEVVPRARALFSTQQQEICAGACLDLSNQSMHYDGRVSYRINGGELIVIQAVQPTLVQICPPNAGRYELVLYVSNDLSRDSMVMVFEVIEFPEELAAVTSYEVWYGEEIRLEAGFIGQQYLWTFQPEGSVRLSCTTCPEPIVTGWRSAELTLTASNRDCERSKRYLLKVNFVEPELYLPTAFTPNGDGINEVFRAEGQFFRVRRLRIYDRYGGVLYEGIGPDASWDGRSRGLEVQPGVYTWQLEYEDIYGEPRYRAGELSLIR